MYQDNKSAILLETHKKMSSSNHTKHIKVRFFFIKDVIACGYLSVDYCPTEKMWADVLTKPLQRTTFKEMRAMLMNFPVDYVDSCTKYMDKIAVVSNPDYCPTPSRLMKPSEKKIYFMASPQKCGGGVPGQQDSQNSKEPKRLHLEPAVHTSDYYVSKIGEVPQFPYPRRYTTFHQLIGSLPILEYLRIAMDLLLILGLILYNNLLY